MRGTVAGVEAEHWALTSPEGRALLEEVAAVATPGPADLSRWRSRVEPTFVAAALRLVESRRKGIGKFSLAREMWLEPIGVEQATSEVVACHKAARFAAGSPVVVDFCSGVGGDALALARVATGGVLAIDDDPGMNRRVAWNARVYGVSDRLLAIRARAESSSIPRQAWAHIDPDRRTGDGRVQGLAGYAPGVSFLRSLLRVAPGGAIKLGPASDFAEHLSGLAVEFELISLGGECKEATVWFGAAAGCRRRATVLPAGATWTDEDGDFRPELPVVPEPSWVFDPDPALVRSGLLNDFASAHGLGRLAAGVDYLAAQGLITSPFLASFEVLAVLPLDLKIIRAELRARQVGTLEVKTRGVSHRPEAVRAALKLTGDRAATLILAGGDHRGRAVIARRLPALS